MVFGSVALLMIYLLASTMIMPFFSQAWRYCQQKHWVVAQGGVNTNCTLIYQTANTTAVTQGAATHTELGETIPLAADSGIADNYCVNCGAAGGYRVSNQGLQLFVLIIALIGFGVSFMSVRP